MSNLIVMFGPLDRNGALLSAMRWAKYDRTDYVLFFDYTLSEWSITPANQFKMEELDVCLTDVRLVTRTGLIKKFEGV